MKFKSFGVLLTTAAASTLAGGAGMQSAVAATNGGIEQLALKAPVTTDKVDPRLRSASGAVDLVVQLSGRPIALANGANSKRLGGTMTPAQQSTYSKGLSSAQSSTMTKIAAMGGQEVARVRIAYNALIIRVDASRIASIAAFPEVLSVRPVGEYEVDLSNTVPYVGASAAQGAGFDGTGVRVAVLDSGIDFMHKNLGGPGTVADYNFCFAQKTSAPSGICANYFGPGAPKVIGGYDFVGEVWPNGARAEDPNPIDGGSAAGHGSHVADIIAGKSADGTHVGVAPGAQLYAVKVCSSVSTSCNGVALLLGMDFALDPNGDGSMKDAVDVVNMSLGSSYGQIEDDLSGASANAVKAGVVVVASAGNSADRPYITGSPSSTPEVISVAQTSMPNATAIPLVINSPANIAGTYGNTSTVDWAPVGAGFTGNVVYTGSAPISKPLACVATDLPAGSLAGKVALIDRGTCAVSIKVDNAAKAGAIGVLIANNASGDAPTFSFGGPTPFTSAPTLIITQSYGNLIKANLAAPVNVTVSSASAIPLAGSMASTSSRGPSYSFNQIKPEIGAPGASLSAEYGTGSGQTAFGGTSGAAPVVAGSAAILLQAFPKRTPDQIKAALMNTADTNVYTNPATQPGVLAPITRIGAGEVRVDQALAATTAVWDGSSKTAGLSFGYLAVDKSRTVCRSVNVRNYGGGARTYSVGADFRYASDAASGAVTPSVPASIAVPAGGDASFQTCLNIDAAKLPIWNVNGGSQGGNGASLQGVEFDGYLTIKDSTDTVTIPWHILPHRAADVGAVGKRIVLSSAGSGSLTLANKSLAQNGAVDVFALTGTSGRIPTAQLPKTGDNFAIIDLRSVGVRYLPDAGGVLQFAVNTYGERAHPAYPAEFDVYVDTNSDGTADYVVFTAENGGFAASGQTVVFVQKLNPTGAAAAYFFADASLNSGNMIMTVPTASMGLAPGAKFSFSVYAFDNYFTGSLTDSVENMAFTAGQPRFDVDDYFPVIPYGGNATLTVQAVTGGAAASPSQSGLLLMYRDAAPGREAEAIPVSGK